MYTLIKWFVGNQNEKLSDDHVNFDHGAYAIIVDNQIWRDLI